MTVIGDALSVTCPACSAEPGFACMPASGPDHRERWGALAAQQAMQRRA